jgi:hypothetical protein
VLLAMLLRLDAMSLVMPDPDKLDREMRAAEGRLLAEQNKLAIWTEKLIQHPEVDTYHTLVIQSETRVKAVKAEVEALKGQLTGGEKLNWQEIRFRLDLKDKNTRRRINAFLHRLGVQVRIADGYLVIQDDEARGIFAVAKHQIGYLALEGGIPDFEAANGLAARVKALLSKPGGGFVHVGTLTVPNGRGTRRPKPNATAGQKLNSK